MSGGRLLKRIMFGNLEVQCEEDRVGRKRGPIAYWHSRGLKKGGVGGRSLG